MEKCRDYDKGEELLFQRGVWNGYEHSEEDGYDLHSCAVLDYSNISQKDAVAYGLRLHTHPKEVQHRSSVNCRRLFKKGVIK